MHIFAHTWRDYGSVSFYDAQANSYTTIGIDPNGDGVDIVFGFKNNAVSRAQIQGARHIQSPTRRGLILIRLAPSEAAFDAAAKIANHDMCQTE